MAELKPVDLLALLPELQNTLGDEFQGVECGVSLCPSLSLPPFLLPFPHIGRHLSFLPDAASVDSHPLKDSAHRLPIGKTLVLTDGEPNMVVEVVLGCRGKDWRTPLSALFQRVLSSPWAFLILELESSHPVFHVLSSDHPPAFSTRDKEETPDSTCASSQVSSSGESQNSESVGPSLWLLPFSSIHTVPKKKIVKTVKKVVKKSVDGTATEDKGTGTPRKSPSGTKVVKKKKEEKEKTPDGSSFSITVPLPKTPSNGILPAQNGSSLNGTHSPPPSAVINGSSSTVTNGSSTILNGSFNAAPASSQMIAYGQPAPPRPALCEESRRPSIPSSSSFASPLLNGSSSRINRLNGHPSASEGVEDEIAKLRKSLERLSQERESPDRNRTVSRASVERKSRSSSERRLDTIVEGVGRKERRESPVKVVVHEATVVCRGGNSPREIPVLALQQTLKRCFNFKELGRLRAVSTHWDEICGQLLNSAYYKLLEKCDKLLMSLQRRLPSEPELHNATAILTNIQVHVLNPVDVMRAGLDDGVCCFPYGSLLDRCFRLVDQVEQMVADRTPDSVVDWQTAAAQAKRAQLHYKRTLEKVIEERLGESLRLKAAQRMIRIDSFLVENSVQKLEKESVKAKEELHWEMEQLQQQNQQIKKENRLLKAEHMKLEARVEALEHKLKTLARLFS